jgi:hypothetical protein
MSLPDGGWAPAETRDNQLRKICSLLLQGEV